MLFAVVLVLGVLALDKSFNLVSKLTGSPQVSAVSSPALSNKFCDDPASESQTGCTSFIPSVLAAASTPYQDVSGNVNISGNIKFGAGAYLYSSVNDNFTLHTQTNTPNPNLTIGYGQGIAPGNIDGTKEYFTMNAGKFMFQNGRVGIKTDNPVAPLTVMGQDYQGIRIDGGVNNRLTFVGSGNNNLWNIDNFDGKMRFFREDYSSSGYGNNGVVRMSINDSGHVGIGSEAFMHTWAPSLVVQGSIRAGAGNATNCDIIIGDDVCFKDNQNGQLNVYNVWGQAWTSVNASGFNTQSSRDIKKDITELSDKDFQKMAETLRKLSMFTFRYNTEDQSHSVHTGVIAEESPASILSDDQKGVNLYDYASLALGALKAQQKEIEELKAGSQKLQEQIDILKEEIRALKAK